MSHFNEKTEILSLRRKCKYESMHLNHRKMSTYKQKVFYKNTKLNETNEKLLKLKTVCVHVHCIYKSFFFKENKIRF